MSDAAAEVEDDSVETVPDNQIEDWLDIYAGFGQATTSKCSSQDLENVEELYSRPLRR